MVSTHRVSTLILVTALSILATSAVSADSEVADVIPVEYKDNLGENQVAVVSATVYDPGDGDYCNHKTSEDNELYHCHVPNYLANGFEDEATEEWVTAAKVKAFFDAEVYPPTVWTFVSPATTAGDCHSYAMKDIVEGEDVPLPYWLPSDYDASNLMLDDDYTPCGIEKDAVGCANTDVIDHTWYIDDVFEGEPGCPVRGIKQLSEKSNSSPVYKKTFGSPYILYCLYFRKTR